MLSVVKVLNLIRFLEAGQQDLFVLLNLSFYLTYYSWIHFYSSVVYRSRNLKQAFSMQFRFALEVWFLIEHYQIKFPNGALNGERRYSSIDN